MAKIAKQAGRTVAASIRFPALAAPLALVVCLAAARAAEPPLRFLADGSLVSLNLGEGNVLREAAKPSGFFAVLFTGDDIREIQFQKVSFENGEIRMAGPNGFPRLEFSVTEGGGKLRLDLVRVEGMPLGRDCSLMFRAATATPLTVTPEGAGVKVDDGKHGLRIFWTGPYERLEGEKSFGSVTLRRKP